MTRLLNRRLLQASPGVAGLLAGCVGLLTGLAAPASPAGWTHFVDYSDIRALHERGDTLWVGTGGGVLLLSAASGDVLSTLDASNGLQSNSVRAFLARGATIYAGTDEGLDACRRAGGRIACEPVGAYRDVRHLSAGPSGALHVGTFGHGAAEVRQRVTWVTTADSLLDNKVYAVRETETGDLYYATSTGLCVRTSAAWVSYQAGAGLPRGQVRDIVDARVGRGYAPVGAGPLFYVLVAGRGIYLFDGRRATGILPRGFFHESDVAGIGVGSDGTLWAAGRYGKIGRYRDGVWTAVGEGDEEIATARWRCVHVGRSGVVYFGSADGLVAAADRRGVRKVTVPSRVPPGRVGPMAVDPEGRRYAACGTYLLSFKDDTAGFVIEKDFGSVLAVAVSPDSAVWVAGRWGLFRKQSDRWVDVAPDIDPRAPLFKSVAFDSSGRLWAGAESGEVFRFDGDLWLRCAEAAELGGAAVDALAVDRRGTLWAVSGPEVYSYNGSVWEASGMGRLDSTRFVSLAVDRAGKPILLTGRHLWTFTEGRGWQPIAVPAPQEAAGYRAMTFDGRGRFYLVSEQGITVVGEGGHRQLGTVGPGDRLRGRDATSVMADGDGFLWIGFQRDGISRILLENLWSERVN